MAETRANAVQDPGEGSRGARAEDGAVTAKQAQSERTRVSLIRTAERLFALHGSDNVKIQDINDAAGQRNKSAIYYHFGCKTDFIAAIFSYRFDEFEIICNASLDRMLETIPSPTMHDICVAAWEPCLEVMLSDENWYYFRFAAHYTFNTDVNFVPLEMSLRMRSTRRIAEMLGRLYPGVPKEVLAIRQRNSIFTMTALLSEWARLRHIQTPPRSEAFIRDCFADAMETLAASFDAPYRGRIEDGVRL
ncbi:MAG: TetR/AcrR family transcriptional regulator [Alphaproteobacteria bacterium]|nr:TetR/AcrR family transcriptional regulator [Alphaproteobacteria bacterium]